MPFNRVLLLTIGLTLMTLPAAPHAASSRVIKPFDDTANTHASSIHIDCMDHPQPQLCIRLVEELITELGRFNEAFSTPDLDELAAFFHEDAILFVDTTGRFFRGRDEIRNDFFRAARGRHPRRHGRYFRFSFSSHQPESHRSIRVADDGGHVQGRQHGDVAAIAANADVGTAGRRSGSAFRDSHGS